MHYRTFATFILVGIVVISVLPIAVDLLRARHNRSQNPARPGRTRRPMPTRNARRHPDGDKPNPP